MARCPVFPYAKTQKKKKKTVSALCGNTLNRVSFILADNILFPFRNEESACSALMGAQDVRAHVRPKLRLHSDRQLSASADK